MLSRRDILKVLSLGPTLLLPDSELKSKPELPQIDWPIYINGPQVIKLFRRMKAGEPALVLWDDRMPQATVQRTSLNQLEFYYHLLVEADMIIPKLMVFTYEGEWIFRREHFSDIAVSAGDQVNLTYTFVYNLPNGGTLMDVV